MTARSQRASSARQSVRARLLTALARVFFRPITPHIPLSGWGVVLARSIVAVTLALFSPRLRGTRIIAVDERRVTGERVKGEWVRAGTTTRDDAVILYIHGSGFVICSPRTHRGITSRLSADTGLAVFSADYRLAPRHLFPRAADDVAAAFSWLLDQGYSPEKIVIAGDSAGGHLAMDLTLELGRRALAPPAALALLSPLYDMSFTLAAAQEELAPDPVIGAAHAAKLIALYSDGIDPAHERIKLATTSGKNLPPVLIHAGGAEMLAADARQLAADVRATGGRCELTVWPGQMHVFQALLLLVPEARPALREIAAFILAALPTGDVTAPAAYDHRQAVGR